MADDTVTPPSDTGTGEPKPFSIEVNAQYIKDLSFENPLAPRSLVDIKSQPKIDITVNVNVDRLQEESYEVSLHIVSKASVEEKNLFLMDLTYSGIFTIKTEEAGQIEPILLISCPNLLFPFARRIIGETTRDGGFPPLMINPIDFVALYRARDKEGSNKELN